MIHIKDKTLCCGCTACASICPKGAITMVPDALGFMYPEVSNSLCIDCGLCESICPFSNQGTKKVPLRILAAKNSDSTIRDTSSSGGLFTLLAHKTISEKGVVFGARFDEKWNVVHDYTETVEGLAAFRGSKYVQSDVMDTFRQARDFLEGGRHVLYSGTPCQIAGLKKFLRKEYERLLTVDVVCHGVPSPVVWQKYLKETTPEGYTITEINFRSKTSGWKTFCVEIESEKNGIKHIFRKVFSKDSYMSAFMSNLSLRPSCFRCPAKSGKSGSDITLGDFWGIEDILPEFDDDRGCSLVFANTDKGQEVIDNLDIVSYNCCYDSALAHNPSIVYPVHKPINYDFFMHKVNKSGFIKALIDTESPSLIKKISRVAYRRVKR